MKVELFWIGTVSSLVYCPCLTEYLCTDEYGDIRSDCGKNHTCEEPEPYYEGTHIFRNDTDEVQFPINAAEAALGRHCEELGLLLLFIFSKKNSKNFFENFL